MLFLNLAIEFCKIWLQKLRIDIKSTENIALFCVRLKLLGKNANLYPDWVFMFFFYVGILGKIKFTALLLSLTVFLPKYYINVDFLYDLFFVHVQV